MAIRTIWAGTLAVTMLWVANDAQGAGALAIGACGSYGHAYDFPSIAAARAAALKQCDGKCQVVASIRRHCVAFAFDARKPCGAHGYATAARLAQAQNAALQHCYRYGGQDCVIRAWACDGRG